MTTVIELRWKQEGSGDGSYEPEQPRRRAGARNGSDVGDRSGDRAATKASLEAMTRAWAAEYSARGVRLDAIAPGPVYTPSPSGPEFIAALGETTPMHRASQPEAVAEVVAFLAAPRASYVTGTTVAADGGRRAV